MGIPARELNGYAITNEENLRPLSINLAKGDLLHSWPEFYDPTLGWIQVDPTWGNTSGIDYFTKLDTSHFAFVIKGINSEYPVPAGAYRTDQEKDLIEVEFSQAENEIDFTQSTTLKKKFNWNLIKLLRGYRKYKLVNTGATIVYDLDGNPILPGNFQTIYLHKDTTKYSYKDFNGNLVEMGF